jgi:hypothetical protein
MNQGMLKSRRLLRRTLQALVWLAAALWLLPTAASAGGRAPSKAAPARHVKVKRRRIRYRRYWRHHITLPKAPSKDRTEEIQSALERGGYYHADPSGKWDVRTREALQRFQEDNGLPPTGKLDALSLQKLGLGSDVAGVSAPKQVTSASGPGTVDPLNPKSPGW